MDSPDREAMDLFWAPLRERGNGLGSDLDDKEALCAIAFVKRRFSRHFKQLAAIEMPGGWQLQGWELPTAVPSVAYMAAVHWLEEVLKKVEPAECKKFHDTARELSGDYGEWQTRIRCLEAASSDSNSHRFTSLDGNLFHRAYLDTLVQAAKEGDEQRSQQAQSLIQQISAFSKQQGIKAASPFYAVLIMDGDSLGKQMSDQEKQADISNGLKSFTDGVSALVNENNGFLIYAGGDDVLAILPLEDALDCALQLRQHYNACFADKPEITTSLSGAIEYVHIKTPLQKILRDAHDLLDSVAKEKTGRDALAVRVWKPGGLQLQWAQPWEIATAGQESAELARLIEQLRQADSFDDQFSSKFLYRIRERLEFLKPPEDGNTDALFNEQQQLDLMVMEYLSSGGARDKKKTTERLQQAAAFIQPLLRQCTPVIRDNDQPDSNQWEKLTGNPVACNCNGRSPGR